jgi:surface antigen
MRKAMIAVAAAMALGVAGCETTGGGGYGGGGYSSGGTRLSQCTRNALLGAAAGAAVGAVTAPTGNKTENAAIGAAAGGLGTWGVCKYLDSRHQAKIEGAYMNAVTTKSSVGMNWVGANGQPYVLNVNRPQPAGADCRYVNGTLAVGQGGPQPLPQETYCRNNAGGWSPAA